MNLPKVTAARIAAALGVGVLVGSWIGNVPMATAATTQSQSPGTAGPIGDVQSGIPSRISRAPETLMPATTAPAALTASGASSTSSGAATRERSALSVAHGAAARRDLAYTATFNWSGEFEASTDITSVSGSWTVPVVQASTSLAIVSTWVGIGGMSTTSPLIQAGTTSVETTDGVTYYSAWYELLPMQPYTVTSPLTVGGTASFTVRPGDVMSVSLTNEGGYMWEIAIDNETTGWRYQHTFSYRSTESSAEWITERPAYIEGPASGLYALPDYGTSQFSDLALGRSHGAPATPAALAAFAMYDTTGNVISAPGPVSSATGESFTNHYVKVPARIAGVTADATAAAEFSTAFPASTGDCPGPSATTRAVVLATNKTYSDALASAYLASTLDTGTLLTPQGSLTATTLSEIRDEGITRVYVVGGTLAVSQAVVAQLEGTDAYACGGASVLPGTKKLQVTRIGGATEYDTAAMIAEEAPSSDAASVDLAAAYAGTNTAGGQGLYNATAGNASTAPAGAAAMPTAVLATGTNFQDAEAASTLAYADRLPILLTTPASLSTQALSAIERLGIEQVIVMGGPIAVSDAVVDALEANGISVLRIAGADDTQTAVELAECELGASSIGAGFGWPATGGVVIARGDFYSDGLAGAVVAAGGPTRTSPEPLLLTESPDTVGLYLGSFLTQAGTSGVDGNTVTNLTILGGPEAVTQELANTLSLDLLG